MHELIDPGIKLFGRNIPVLETHFGSNSMQKPSLDQVIPDETEPTAPKADVENASSENPNQQEVSGEDQGAEGDTREQEKVMKRPDKVLPCPRCNSLDTKFCYFNNYNINQPRHFCKNCQRYWTAGGTMRNVPVGAGRRKNKHYPLQHPQPSVPPGPALNLKGQKTSVALVYVAADDKEDELLPSRSSSTTTVIQENEIPAGKGLKEQVCPPGRHGNTIPMQALPTWASPWNPGWNTMVFSPNGSNPNVLQLGCSQPAMAVSRFCSPSNEIPWAVPASHWGCIQSSLSHSSCASNSGSSDNSSPTLGKHSRDFNVQAEEKSEQCLWVPKALRVDDLDEAAKSSIWATLGIKPDNKKPITDGVYFQIPS